MTDDKAAKEKSMTEFGEKLEDTQKRKTIINITSDV